ncbi:MAG: hypothetical protein ACAH12_03615 [Methylophilaceae bacterium]
MAVDPIATPPELPPRKKAGFSDKFSAWLTWFNGDFQTQFNAVIAYFNSAITAFTNNATNATSASNLTIGAGIKNIVITAGKSWMKGQTARIAFDGSPANWEQGTVRSYDPVTGAFEYVVEQTQGGGTSSALIISLAAAPTFLNRLGAAVASAAAINIWTGDGDTIHITGVTTINSFGNAPQAGMRKTLIFDGVCTITNGANLAMPNGINYTTSAGDKLEVIADSTTIMLVDILKKRGEVPGLSTGKPYPWRDLLIEFLNTGATVTIYNPILKNASSESKLFQNIVGVASVLATDLDVGVPTASTWYTLYVIGKEDGTSILRWSLSTSAPALTGGYTRWLRIGTCFCVTLAPVVMRPMIKRDNSVRMNNVLTVFDGAITAGAWTFFSLVDFIPLHTYAPNDGIVRTADFMFGGTGLDMGLQGENGSGLLSGGEIFSGAVAGTASTFGGLVTSRTKYISARIRPWNGNVARYWSNTALGTLYLTGWEE